MKPGWHLHLLGPTQSPCLQAGWHTAVFREEETDQCTVLRPDTLLVADLNDKELNPTTPRLLQPLGHKWSVYSTLQQWGAAEPHPTRECFCLFLPLWQRYYHWQVMIIKQRFPTQDIVIHKKLRTGSSNIPNWEKFDIFPVLLCRTDICSGVQWTQILRRYKISRWLEL